MARLQGAHCAGGGSTACRGAIQLASKAPTRAQPLQRVGLDFAPQHLANQRLAPAQCRPYTLGVGMRSWRFAAFRDLEREGM